MTAKRLTSALGAAALIAFSALPALASAKDWDDWHGGEHHYWHPHHGHGFGHFKHKFHRPIYYPAVVVRPYREVFVYPAYPRAIERPAGSDITIIYRNARD